MYLKQHPLTVQAEINQMRLVEQAEKRDVEQLHIQLQDLNSVIENQLQQSKNTESSHRETIGSFFALYLKINCFS